MVSHTCVPRLVSVLDRTNPCTPPRIVPLDELREVRLARGRRDATERRGRVLHLTLADPTVSAAHACLRRLGDRWIAEDTGSRNGTFVGGCKTRRKRLRPGDMIEVGQRFFVFDVGPARMSSTLGVFTLDPLLASTADVLARLSPAEVPIVIRGEPGSGRAAVAKAIHRHGCRSGPFVPVNCAAPGASLFRRANGAQRGTLFLDEVHELRRSGQAELLEIVTGPSSADVQIVATTHVDLERRVDARRFHPELLGRLCSLDVHLPSLRDRPGDLGLAIGDLLERAGGAATTIDRDAAQLLLSYAWPLNLRELEAALHTALATARDGSITRADLPRHIAGVDPDTPRRRTFSSSQTHLSA